MSVCDGSACGWNIGHYDKRKVISNRKKWKGGAKEMNVAAHFTL